jgi:hypothetical protein
VTKTCPASEERKDLRNFECLTCRGALIINGQCQNELQHTSLCQYIFLSWSFICEGKLSRLEALMAGLHQISLCFCNSVSVPPPPLLSWDAFGFSSVPNSQASLVYQ